MKQRFQRNQLGLYINIFYLYLSLFIVLAVEGKETSYRQFNTYWANSFSVDQATLNEILEDKKQQLSGMNAKYFSLSERESSQQLQCFEDYAEVFNQSQFNLTVVFGYNDNDEGLVSDSYEKSILIESLTKVCPSREILFSCGFYQKNANQLEKVMTINNQSILVNLFLDHSSYSFVDRDNKKEFSEQQKIKSMEAENTYTSGLRFSDVILYVGHSRDGGGPDFFPPRMTSMGKVDYPWYHQNRPGLKKLLFNLKESKKKSPIIGLFSCASRSHFSLALRRTSPLGRFILAEDLSHYKNFAQVLLGTIDASIGMKCPKPFQESLKVLGLKNDLVRLHLSKNGK